MGFFITQNLKTYQFVHFHALTRMINIVHAVLKSQTPAKNSFALQGLSREREGIVLKPTHNER